MSNLKPRDPVILSLCTQDIFQKAVEKADRRVVREKKQKLEKKKIAKEKQNLSVNEPQNEA